MKLGAAGRAILKHYEQGPEGGCALEAYPDSGGVLTIGWGHTAGVYFGQRCSPEQADQWLTEDVAEAEAAVTHYIQVPLTQGQFDALVCFTFNLGGTQLAISTLRRKLNDGDYQGAASEFSRWNRDNGVIMNGLVKRRADEQALFLTGLGD